MASVEKKRWPQPHMFYARETGIRTASHPRTAVTRDPDVVPKTVTKSVRPSFVGPQSELDSGIEPLSPGRV